MSDERPQWWHDQRAARETSPHNLLHPRARSVFGYDEVIRHGVESSGLVVVMFNNGYGRKPWRFMLPHQVSVDVVNRLFEANPDAREVEVATVGAPVLIATHGKYGGLGGNRKKSADVAANPTQPETIGYDSP